MNIELIGSRIKERRLELGITLQEVAEAIDVNKSTIQRYENGKIKDIKTPIIESIASFLNVNPLWLLGKAENKTHSEEYELSTHLMNLHFKSIVKWSEDQFFTEKDTVIIREHFWDLLLRYKQIIEGFANAKHAWEHSKETYRQLYIDRLTDKEIKELFLKNELEYKLDSASDWIKAFPQWITEKEEN
ncbi:helix-turn-helix domain-containing protein [Neobacillus sp. FSL H8-0543]|uniref:helix-turn-helix domain-containing protein n=1 Tax=Neobacillus sp. FSL H8-0543 TaxID=2954672 RepID=UPI003158D321